MLAGLVVALRSLTLICGGHRAVALENLALRQQVGGVQAHREASPTPPPRPVLAKDNSASVRQLRSKPDERGTVLGTVGAASRTWFPLSD
jgi:hypothetical protein